MKKNNLLCVVVLIFKKNENSTATRFSIFISYIIVSLILLFAYTSSLASAWFTPKGQYRYSATYINIDGNSQKLKRIRADIYLQIQKELVNLQESIKELNPSSARYKNLANKIKF